MRTLRSIAVLVVMLGLIPANLDAAAPEQIDVARDKGLAWLVRQQRADGSWRSVAGTEFAATATVIEAFGAANVKTAPYVAAVAWLSNVTVVSVDSMARQIIALTGAGLNLAAATQTLVSWRNPDLAWGAYEAFGTTYPDTALALGAVRVSPLASYTDADLKAALCRILVAQKTTSDPDAGSWSYTYRDASGPTNSPPGVTGSAILPTVHNALEIRAINDAKGATWNSIDNCAGAPSPTTVYDLATVVTKALDWLLSKRNPGTGGFGENGVTVLETALAYQAFSTLRPTDPAAEPALDYLLNPTTQKPDGSWHGDPFQTALVLKVMRIGTPYGDSDPDQDGLPNRLETQLQTDPDVKDSRWIAPDNSLRSYPGRTAANDFGILTTGLEAADEGRRPSESATSAPALRNGRGFGPGARDRNLPHPLALTVSLDGFRVDLYTGAAVAEIPIAVPPAAGGVSPAIVLRYDSLSVDALASTEPGPGTGLGWMLVTGPVIVRDHKGTESPADDTFILVLNGKRYPLVLVDSAQAIYHTTDETFLKLQYTSGSDAWTLTTKDGTRYDLGNTPDSKQKTLVAPPWTESVTSRYLTSAVTSTSGVAITYAYTVDTASVGAQVYDQSIVPSTITYAVVGGATLGTARQVTFVWSARNDWPLSLSAPKHFDMKKLDAIEVRVGANLLRRYDLTYDDASIDRSPGVSWDGGGATGDLALRSVTLRGTDGSTALPTASFYYESATGRLTAAANGLGAEVSYDYTTLSTLPLYSVCSTSSCSDWAVCSDPNPEGFPAAPFLGYLVPSTEADTVPVYSVCAAAGGYGGCGDWGVAATPSGSGWRLLGYALTPSLPQIPGTLALYSVNQGGWKAVVASTPPAGGTLLGYIYPESVSRYGRVQTRTVLNGASIWATGYTYSVLALEADGSPRGYASTRQIEPQITYADDTYINRYFSQADETSGRVNQEDTYSGPTLLRRTVNTWTVTTPYPTTAPAVKVATLTQADVTTYDGGVALTTRRTWQYDAYANVRVARSEGDLAVIGDEREEQTDWLVDTTTWIHRPSRVALYDAAGGAVVRERWLSYDTLAWGALGSRGLPTREERRLTGTLGTSGNAVSAAGYDAYGNVTSTTDPGNCTTTTAYDTPADPHAVPRSVTTCLSHVTVFGYDPYARRTSVTDPNNQGTQYAFDPVGRLTRITGPLDTASPNGSVSYEYLNWGTPTTQIVRTLRTKLHGQSATTWSDEYFDGLGRVYTWRSLGPGAGQTIARTRGFNTRGWVAVQSAPYILGETPVVHSFYTYDPLGRVTQVAYPDGTAVTTAYGAVAGTGSLATVTDERGSVKRYFTDAHDQLVKVEEVIGTTTAVTTYTYDAVEALKTVTGATGAITTMDYDLLGRRTSLVDPNLGTWSWVYDTRGNLTSRTDARTQTVTYTYDEQSRIKTKTVLGGVPTVWTYDESEPPAPHTKGRLTRIVDPVSTTTFGYDAPGRVTQTSRLLDGTTYVLQQGYDAAGRVTSHTFPDGETVSYVYNDAGWLERIPGYVEGAGGTPGILYNARGQRTQITFVNGVTTALAYHPTSFRLTWLLTTGSGGTLQNLAYGYDNAGNLTQIADAVGTAGRTFVYDAVNRLTRASGWFNGAAEDYSYDAAGNLLRRAALLYAYSDPAHPWAVTAVVDGRSFTHDANGNAETAAGRTLVWNAEGQLGSMTSGGRTVTLAYDAVGQRIKTTTPAGVTRAPFPGYEIAATGVIRKSPGLAVKEGSVTRFLHDDHLGSTHVVTDANGYEAQRVEFDAWGQVTRLDGAVESTVRFRADDAGVGTRARHYDPALGRMLSADPVPVDLADPQTLNPYAYARNNPASPAVRRPDGAASGL